MKYLLLIVFCTGTAQPQAYNVPELLAQQAASPEDPRINYNLGVAQYKTSSYESAAQNFKRAYANAGNDNKLVKHAQFNAGKSFEQYGLHLLPSEWESEKTNIEDATLAKAVKALENAIAEYKVDSSDEKTQKNLASTEETLAKLRKKKQQQEQDKKDGKDKDQKKGDDKGDKQEQQEQSGDQSQQNDGKPGEQKPGEKKPEGSKDNKDVDKNKQQGDEHKEQDAGEKSPEQAGKPGDKRDEQKPDDDGTKDGKQDEQDKFDHNASDKQEGSPEHQAVDEGTPGTEKKQETLQERRMQAILENLQADESKKQKGFLVRQLEKTKQQEHVGQKPW